MKIRVTFKDPDGVFQCIEEAAKDSIEALEGLSEDEHEALLEKRQERFKEATKKWIEYGEYLTVEIDTDAGTIEVVPVK